MTRIAIRRTNRRIKESPFLTACKEQDGLLGNIEMTHITDIDDILDDKPYYVDIGSNVKRLKDGYSVWTTKWSVIADELSKPGVFDKLVRYFRK
jgi:hypothetical protein